uniref:Protein kinase domain-containing protein n=1 Tax=Bos indicus x Bos taurus TaxID=30522 RepID=A0A4W2FBV6_BOBOX
MASSSGPRPMSLVGGRYKLVREIGSGSFGHVHLAIDLTNHEQVAVKLESQNTRQPRLLYEKELYNILQGGVGIPQIRWYVLKQKEAEQQAASSSGEGQQAQTPTGKSDKTKSEMNILKFESRNRRQSRR